MLHLRLQEPERVRICELKFVQRLSGQFFVRLPNLLMPVRVGVVFSELANLPLLVEFALLRLEIVVRYVQQFVLYLNRERL